MKTRECESKVIIIIYLFILENEENLVSIGNKRVKVPPPFSITA